MHLGRELSHNGQIDRDAMEANAAPVLRRLGAEFGPKTLVSKLSIAEQQLVEIGISDRVVVMRDGIVAGEIAGSPSQPITQEAIIELATGALTAAA